MSWKEPIRIVESSSWHLRTIQKSDHMQTEGEEWMVVAALPSIGMGTPKHWIRVQLFLLLSFEFVQKGSCCATVEDRLAVTTCTSHGAQPCAQVCSGAVCGLVNQLQHFSPFWVHVWLCSSIVITLISKSAVSTAVMRRIFYKPVRILDLIMNPGLLVLALKRKMRINSI